MKKQFIDTLLGEALTPAQRIKARLRFKKIANKIKRGRELASKKIASPDAINRRAHKQARLLMTKKILKGKAKDELSFNQRAELENKLNKRKNTIDRIAKRLIPIVRKADREKFNNSSE